MISNLPVGPRQSSVERTPERYSESFAEEQIRSTEPLSAMRMQVSPCLRLVSLAALPDVLYDRASAYLSPEG